MSEYRQRLDTYLREYERLWPLSGTVLAARDGEVLLRRAYGCASHEHQVPNTVDTRFRIWSITKTFTAMAIMLLFERKLLRFDDSISLYIPGIDHLSNITVEQLLNHTSGLFNYTNVPAYNGRLNKVRLAREEVLPLFVNEPLAFEPGTSFSYNNSGYYLLGIIIENIAGLAYEAFVQDNLLQPLGMLNTGFDDNKRIIPNMSSAYNSTWDTYLSSEYMDMSSSFAAGSMYSTVDDLYLWDQALYAEQLVSDATKQLAFQSRSFSYGYGWFLDQPFGRKRIHHGGAYRGHRSELHRYPDDRATVIVLTNYDFVPVHKLADTLARIMFGEDNAPPERPAAYVPLETAYADYIGTYEGFGCKAVVSRDGDRLQFIWNDESGHPLYPIGEHTFHHTWCDWQYRFTQDEDGKMTFLGMPKISRS